MPCPCQGRSCDARWSPNPGYNEYVQDANECAVRVCFLKDTVSFEGNNESCCAWHSAIEVLRDTLYVDNDA